MEDRKKISEKELNNIRNKRYRKTQKCKDNQHEYYEKNKDKIKKNVKKWQKNNPEKVKLSAKKSWINWVGSPKYIYHLLKENCRKKKREFPLKQKDFLNWYNKEDKVCHYCGIPETEIEILNKHFNKEYTSRLTIDRVDNNKPYQIDNIVLACMYCNRIKSDLFNEEDFKALAHMFIKPIWLPVFINKYKKEENNE